LASDEVLNNIYLPYVHAELTTPLEFLHDIETTPHIKKILDDVRTEIQGASPVVERLPLYRQFANFETWFANAFPGQIVPTMWHPPYNLPAVLEALWDAQDTGDQEKFKQVVETIKTLWNEKQEKARVAYRKVLLEEEDCDEEHNSND
jgi:hypothetical protein